VNDSDRPLSAQCGYHVGDDVEEIMSLLNTNPWTDTQTNAGLAGTVDPNFAGK
jgi:hypothetical protein